MEPGFEFFDHTADLGVRVRAADLPTLLQTAGQALYSVIGELQPAGEPRPERFELVGPDRATLLRDYLAELLLVFERDHRMLTRANVEAFEPNRLVVTGESEAIDQRHSGFDREVKAITYHGLKLHTTDENCEAEYIVDI